MAVFEDGNEEQQAIVLAELEDELLLWDCGHDGCDGEPHGYGVPHARAAQLPPAGFWLVWLIIAGRGFGKTRAGGEYVKKRLRESVRGHRVALIGATLDDVRDTMIEGESGLLSILPTSMLRGGTIDSAWNRSMCELYLANESKCKGFSSEKPDKLRGPQHHTIWGDEPMSWRDAHLGPEVENTTWSNAMLGLRLGDDPRCVVTGTPKPRRLLVGSKDKPGIMAEASTVVTRGSTYDNLANLAPTFRQQILSKYEGTRTGRQELNAEILDTVDGALWKADDLDADRADPARVQEWRDGCERIVTAADPAVTSGEDSDETGIIVAGRTDAGRCPRCGTLAPDQRHVFVFADESGRYTPHQWASRLVGCHDRWLGDRVVGEVNNGGELVEANLRTVDPGIPYTAVHASRGKRVRAEPVAALTEQHRVHIVGVLDELEEQLTSWVPDQGDSPDRLDAFVWAATELVLGEPERKRSLSWH